MAKSKAALSMKSPMIKLLAVGAAYFLVADPVNNFIDTKILKAPTAGADGTVPARSQLLKYGIIAAEGIPGYMLLMKGKSSLVKTGAGAVLTAAALKRALKEFGVVSGYQRVPVIGSYQRVPVIGGAGNQGYRVNGTDGYRVNGRGTSAVMGGMGHAGTEGSDLL